MANAPVANMNSPELRQTCGAKGTGVRQPHAKHWYIAFFQREKWKHSSWEDFWNGIGANEDPQFQQRINLKAKELTDPKKLPPLELVSAIEELEKCFMREIYQLEPDCTKKFRDALWSKVLKNRQYDQPAWGTDDFENKGMPNRSDQGGISSIPAAGSRDIASVSTTDSESVGAISEKPRTNNGKSGQTNTSTIATAKELQGKAQDHDGHSRATNAATKTGSKRLQEAENLPGTPESMDRSPKRQKATNEPVNSPEKGARPRRSMTDALNKYVTSDSDDSNSDDRPLNRPSARVNSATNTEVTAPIRKPRRKATTVTPDTSGESSESQPDSVPNSSRARRTGDTQQAEKELPCEISIVPGFKPTKKAVHGRIQIGYMYHGKYKPLHEGKFTDKVIEKIFDGFKKKSKMPVAQMEFKLHDTCHVPDLETEGVVLDADDSPPYIGLNEFLSQSAIKERSRLGLTFVAEPIVLEDFYEMTCGRL